MPLVPIPTLFSAARAGGYALGYFESWNLESLQGVIDAAEQTHSPVIIGFNGEFLTSPERLERERIAWYGALGRAAAESASVPCGFLFNECASEDAVRLATEVGFNLVMWENPQASYAEQIQHIARLADYAHSRNAAIEAESGELPNGSDGRVDTAHSSLTDLNRVAEFVQSTHIDLLSVSVGNIHIMVDGQHDLNLDHLAEIRRRVDIPLGLHGGTGIRADSLRQAIGLGVTKVAYGTYLKQAYLNAVRKGYGVDELNPHKLLGMGGEEDVLVAGRRAVRDAVLERIELLGCCGRG